MRGLFLFIVVSLGWISVPGQAVSSQHPFPVFDATDFAQKPDLNPYGLKRLPVVYPAYMFDSKEQAVQTNLPDQKRVNAFARLAAQSSNILVIDIGQSPWKEIRQQLPPASRNFRPFSDGSRVPHHQQKSGSMDFLRSAIIGIPCSRKALLVTNHGRQKMTPSHPSHN